MSLKISRGFAHTYLFIAWLIVLALFIWLRHSTNYLQDNRVLLAPGSPKATAQQEAMQVGLMISPRMNPYTGPVFHAFFSDSMRTAQDEVPAFPEPYSRFMFLLRGYIVGNQVTYISPWLPEAELPKSFIEATIKIPPYSNLKDPHFECYTQPKKRNDTTFFRTMLIDYDKKEAVYPILAERALRWSLYGGNFYPLYPATWDRRESVATRSYFLITRFGKVVYSSTPFDTAKVSLVNDSWEGLGKFYFPTPPAHGYRERIYTADNPEKYDIDKALKLFKRWEWETFALYTLALVMLLRGVTIRDAIAEWWKKEK